MVMARHEETLVESHIQLTRLIMDDFFQSTPQRSFRFYRRILEGDDVIFPLSPSENRGAIRE